MCPKQVHEGSSDLLYVPKCVVMIDWGNPRGQIFSRTGFAPSGTARNRRVKDARRSVTGPLSGLAILTLGR